MIRIGRQKTTFKTILETGLGIKPGTKIEVRTRFKSMNDWTRSVPRNANYLFWLLDNPALELFYKMDGDLPICYFRRSGDKQLTEIRIVK